MWFRSVRKSNSDTLHIRIGAEWYTKKIKQCLFLKDFDVSWISEWIFAFYAQNMYKNYSDVIVTVVYTKQAYTHTLREYNL